MTTERIDIIVSERGARPVRQRIAGIGDGAQRAQGGVQLLRRALGALGGALILTKSIKTLAEFAQSMSTVKAITGATAEGFRALTERARELGAKTRFTATQAAEGMVFLARTGFNTVQVLGTINSALELAQAGALGIAEAADIASNVLKGFGLKVSQTARIVDVLALSSSKANTTVQQLGSAMSFVAPAAAALSIDIETTAAAIGALSDAGIQATRAGTGLRQIFIKLGDVSDKAKSRLRILGLTVADINIQTRGLIPVLETLKDAELDFGAAVNLVEGRQASSLLILIKQLPRIKELILLNREAAGTARRMADVMDDNLNGALLRVKSAFESIILSLGAAGGAGGIRSVMENLAVLFRVVASNAETLGKVLVTLGSIILGRLVIGALTLLVVGLKTLGATLLALTTRLIPALGIAAIAAFTIMGVMAISSGKTIKEVFGGIVSDVTNFVESLLSAAPAVNAFDRRINAFRRSVVSLGGFSNLTSDVIDRLVKRVGFLQKQISKKLLLQQFLAPGSEGAKQLAEQLEVVTDGLTLLKKLSEEKAITQIVSTGVRKKDVVTIPKTTPALLDFITNLKRENQLLMLNNEEADVRLALFQAFDAAERTLTETEEKKIEKLVRSNTELTRQRELLQAILSPLKSYEDGVNDLRALLDKGQISLQQFNIEMRRLGIAALESSTDALSGFERGFLKIQDLAADTASFAEDSLVSAFRRAEDALVEFATGGKLSFRSLIDSMLKDLARFAIRQALVGIATKFLKIPGLAHGGSFLVGGSGGVDQNVLSINGSPAARVSRGERVTVGAGSRSGGGRAGGGVTIQINAPGADEGTLARMLEIVEARVVPQAVEASRAISRRDIARPSFV